MATISFLFGAGAEINYGFPSGGKFALDIFRENSTNSKEDFKNKRTSIDKTSSYAANWLPEKYITKSVSSFGNNVFETIVKDTLEHNRKVIISQTEIFDEIAKTEEKNIQKKYPEFSFSDIITKYLNKPIDECNLSQSMIFNHAFNKEGNNIFKSNYFSAIALLYKQKKSTSLGNTIGKILLAILQLQIGALSEGLSRNVNENIFETKDDSFDFLDDIGNIISLNYQSIGISGLELLNEKSNFEPQTEDEFINLFLIKIMESIYSSVLDYKSLIDSHWRYLYCPKEEWTKFCKISIFLITVKKYMEKQIKQIIPNSEGFYHDLKNFIGKNDLVIPKIATTNYSSLIEDVLDEDIFYLNGSINLLYDPYLNKIGKAENLDSKHFLVPLLFTQSGTKPMTSIKMTCKYVDMYKSYKKSDAICIVGFGFNLDDEHINGIIRTLIDEDNKHIFVVDIKNITSKDIGNKLKVKKKDNIHIIKVDKNRKISDTLWTEYLNNEISILEINSNN